MKDGCRCKVDVTRRHFDRYKEILIDALRLKSTVAKHTNVMMRMLGYFKKDLTGDEKQEMLEIIQA